MNSEANVTAGKPKTGGALYKAPAGTTLPTDAVTALDVAFVCLGYLGEDGLSNDGSATTQTVKAWGGDVVLDVQTEKNDKFKFKLIEAINADVLKAVYRDDNVSGTLSAGISVTVNGKERAECVWVAEMVLKGGVLKRIVIPRGKIVTVDEIAYKDGEAVGYASTLSAYPDSSGNTHYEYLKSAS